MEIIVKRYEHYNRALGKYIHSKKQYKEEMKRGGFVSFEKGKEIAEKARTKMRKSYGKLSDKSMDIIRSAKQMKDHKGRIRPGGRMIDAMKEVGVNFYDNNIPKAYREWGGFDAI